LMRRQGGLREKEGGFIDSLGLRQVGEVRSVG